MNRPEGFSPIGGKFLRAFFKFCKLIRLRLNLAGLPAADVLRLSFDSVEYPFSGSKNGAFGKKLGSKKNFFWAFIFNSFWLI